VLGAVSQTFGGRSIITARVGLCLRGPDSTSYRQGESLRRQ